MTMTEWFLAELTSEAAKSQHVLEQMPSGKRAWKPQAPGGRIERGEHALFRDYVAGRQHIQ